MREFYEGVRSVFIFEDRDIDLHLQKQNKLIMLRNLLRLVNTTGIGNFNSSPSQGAMLQGTMTRNNNKTQPHKKRNGSQRFNLSFVPT
jgi:hypothetical protein